MATNKAIKQVPQRRHSTVSLPFAASISARGTAAETADLLYQAGVRRFYGVGYHGASLREIAEPVGINAAALYYHFPSKQELLFAIVSRTLSDLIRECQRAVDGARGSEARLRAFMRAHARFHGSRRLEAGVSDAEYRHLTEARRAEAVDLRDRFQGLLEAILEEGVAERVFVVADLKVPAYAILTVGTNVALWYRPDGRMTLEDIADQYGEIAVGIAGARVPSTSVN